MDWTCSWNWSDKEFTRIQNCDGEISWKTDEDGRWMEVTQNWC